MIKLMIKSKLPDFYNALISDIEVQRDDALEIAVRQFCKRLGINYDPYMYLKVENGGCLDSSTKLEYYYKYQ